MSGLFCVMELQPVWREAGAVCLIDIGPYSLAVLARAHQIPFYVAAPSSTVDLEIADGDAIPIEYRDPQEVTHLGGQFLAPVGWPRRTQPLM